MALLTFNENNALAQNLAAWFKFEETTGTRQNQVQTGNAVEVGGEVASAPGLVGAALHGNTANRLEIPQSAALDPGAGSFTAQDWVYIPSGQLAVGDAARFCRAVSYGGNAINLGVSLSAPELAGLAERPTAETFIFDGSHIPVANPTLTLNAWNHILLRLDRATSLFTIWVNGAQVMESPQPDFGALAGQKWQFNTSQNGPLDYKLDEFAFWKRAISDAEIAQLYNAGQGATYSPINASMTVSPPSIPAGTANQTVILTGQNTGWSNSAPPQFAFSGVAGVTISNRVVNSPTSASITVSTSTTLGAGTVTDPQNGIAAALAIAESTYASGVSITVPAGLKLGSQGALYQHPGLTYAGTNALEKGYVYIAPDVNWTPQTQIALVGCNFSPKAVTYELALQLSNGAAPVRITKGGQNSFTVQPGQFYTTDVFTVGAVPGDGILPVRQAISWIGAGNTISGTENSNLNRRDIGGGWDKGFLAGAASRLMEVGVEADFPIPSDGACLSTPSLALVSGYGGPRVHLLADSILTHNTKGGVAGFLFPGVPYINSGIGGDALGNFFASPGVFASNTQRQLDRIRLATLPLVDYLCNTYGHNDIYDNPSSQNGLNHLTNIRALATRQDFTGQFIQWTLTPDTHLSALGISNGKTINNALPSEQEGRVGSAVAVTVNGLMTANKRDYHIDYIWDTRGVLRVNAQGQPDPNGQFWGIPNLGGDGTHGGAAFVSTITAPAVTGGFAGLLSRPAISGAATNIAGTQSILTLDKAVSSAGVVGDYTLKVGGVARTITSVSLVDSTHIALSHNAVNDAASLTLSVEYGAIVAVDGSTTAAAANLVVSNQSGIPAPDMTAPLVGVAALATNGLTLTVPFTEVMNGSTGLGVRVGGAARAAAISGSGGTRFLTLSSAAYQNEAVTLGYLPGNLADLAGNALAAFADLEVENLSTVPLPLPIVPANFASTGANGRVLLEWSANSIGVAGYELDLNGTTFDAGPVTSYLDSGLENGVLRSYRIRAYNAAGGHSAWSEPITATPSAVVDVVVRVSGPKKANLTFRLTMDAPAPVGLNGEIQSTREFEATTNADGEGTFRDVFTGSTLRAAKRFDTYTLVEQTTATKARVRVPDEGGNVFEMIVS